LAAPVTEMLFKLLSNISESNTLLIAPSRTTLAQCLQLKPQTSMFRFLI
jgi:hypothetical protein